MADVVDLSDRRKQKQAKEGVKDVMRAFDVLKDTVYFLLDEKGHAPVDVLGGLIAALASMQVYIEHIEEKDLSPFVQRAIQARLNDLRKP